MITHRWAVVTSTPVETMRVRFRAFLEGLGAEQISVEVAGDGVLEVAFHLPDTKPHDVWEVAREIRNVPGVSFCRLYQFKPDMDAAAYVRETTGFPC